MDFKNILIICLVILLFFFKKTGIINCEHNKNSFDQNNDGEINEQDFDEFTQRAFENNVDLMKTYGN